MLKIEITKAESTQVKVLEVPDMVTGIALLHDELMNWETDQEDSDVVQFTIVR